MTKNFVFMVLNTIFLPLTGFLSIREFLSYLYDNLEGSNDISDVVNSVTFKLGIMGTFFLRFLCQVTFVSNGIQLLDIPHFFVKSIRKCCHKNKQTEFKDTWFFDLGYHQSYSLAIFTLGLLFSIIMPLAAIFSFLFFCIKYYVEKYNMMYVYQKEFESKGGLKKKIIPFANSAIFIFQFINYGFLGYTFDTRILYAGGVLLMI